MVDPVREESLISLPVFPDFRPIELADREFVEDLLRREQPESSELNFANTYLWRRKYGFEIAGVRDGVAIRALDRSGGRFFLQPIGVSDAPDAAKEMLSADGADRLCRVQESKARELEEHGFHIESDRDNSDYVYLASDLISLPGRKYHRKRNHIAQFQARYGYEYRRVGPDLVQQCMELQETWCDIRDCFIPENRPLAEEHSIVMEALSLLEQLELTAGAVIIDAKVAAFAVGGELNRETMLIHFEKANPAYPGLYQVMNREFAADAAAGYRYINREQDLGDEGLRKSKQSYYPHHMVNKYVVTL
jgi:hypothetical protein